MWCRPRAGIGRPRAAGSQQLTARQAGAVPNRMVRNQPVLGLEGGHGSRTRARDRTAAAALAAAVAAAAAGGGARGSHDNAQLMHP